MSAKKQSMNGDGAEKDIFETSKGAKIKLLGVSPMLIQKTQTAGTLPPVPTREMATAFGEAQKDELSAEDLQTDEEKRQWREYEAARDAVLEKRQQNFFRAVFSKGTEVDETEIEDWKREQVEDWGWDVPENRLDVKVEYIQTELITTPEELIELVLAVLEKSNLPEEAMAEARATFRSTLRQSTPESAQS